MMNGYWGVQTNIKTLRNSSKFTIIFVWTKVGNITSSTSTGYTMAIIASKKRQNAKTAKNKMNVSNIGQGRSDIDKEYVCLLFVFSLSWPGVNLSSDIWKFCALGYLTPLSDP